MRKMILSLMFLFSFVTLTYGAVNYQMLAPLPDATGNTQRTVDVGGNSLQSYFNNLYRMGIALATGLAVLMIILGGIEYITTDAIGGKEEGKERISNAILGLLLALSSFVILKTIDPNLVNVSLDITQVDQGQLNKLLEKETSVFLATVEGHGQGGPPEAGGTILGTLAQAWGANGASDYQGQKISDAKQFYYAINEENSDSDTDAGNGPFGQKLVVGAPGVTGSAASVFYPAGTLFEINGIRYVVDDHNMKKVSGGFQPVNQHLTNAKGVDIFTSNKDYANKGGPQSPMTILYVPDDKITDYNKIKDIRENPDKYITSE